MRNLIDAIWPVDGSIRTLLDLGCGDLWFSYNLPGVEKHIGVDIWQPYLDKALEKNPIGFKGYCMDIREFVRLQAPASYDCIMAIDVIEHFEEEEAKWLVAQMDRIASKLVIVWTTLGHIFQAGVDNNGEPNPYQEHKSGPSVDWFPVSEGWQIQVHPDWHGARGGAIFAYKYINSKPIFNIMDL